MGGSDLIRLGLHGQLVNGVKWIDSVFYFDVNMLIWASYQRRRRWFSCPLDLRALCLVSYLVWTFFFLGPSRTGRIMDNEQSQSCQDSPRCSACFPNTSRISGNCPALPGLALLTIPYNNREGLCLRLTKH